MTRTPRSASSVARSIRPSSKNCASSMPTTCTSGSSAARSSRLSRTESAETSRRSRVTTRSGRWRTSADGLKTWTFWRAMRARRSRRSSSSLLPENIPPAMISIWPAERSRTSGSLVRMGAGSYQRAPSARRRGRSRQARLASARLSNSASSRRPDQLLHHQMGGHQRAAARSCARPPASPGRRRPPPRAPTGCPRSRAPRGDGRGAGETAAAR